MNGRGIAGIWSVIGALALSGLAAPQDTAGPGALPFSVVPDAEGAVELTAVLAAFEEATGWRLTMDEETRRLVEVRTFFASGPIECGPADVVRVFGSLLASQKLVWSVVRPEAPRVLGLASLETTARGTARQNARYVPAPQLADFAGSHGLLIQTLLDLPHTDVRMLSNSMRSMVVDPNTLQIIPVGNTSSLLLQGFAPNLADLVDMLRATDRASAGEEPLPPGHRPPPLHGAIGELTLPTAPTEEVDDRPGRRREPPGMTLLDLVVMHARATGQVAVLDDEAERLLQTRTVALSSPVTLTGDAFATFCEELLLEGHFVVTDLSHGGPCLYHVQSLETTARGTARQDARYVDAGSIELCERRPASLFQTLITLPHTDVRTLSNSMRSMVVDPNTLQLIPVGDTHSLVLQGFGRSVAELVRMLRRVDAAAAEAAASAPADEEDDG